MPRRGGSLKARLSSNMSLNAMPPGFATNRSDHAAFRQNGQFPARQSQFAAKDFHVVLADQRRPLCVSGRGSYL